MAILRGPLVADNFTLVPNRWTRDPRLSWGAKGLLAYIAGHAVGYELTMAQMMREGNLGRDGLLTLIRELEEYGHLRRTRQRDQGGRLGSYDYALADPDHAGQDHGGSSRTGAEQPEPEFSQVATSAAQATMAEAAHKEEHTSEEDQEKTNPPGGDAAAPHPDPEIKPETAQDVVAAWIDYCTGHEIKLPKQVIGRYAREIKNLLDEGHTSTLVKHALKRMLERGKASNAALLPAFVVEVQGQRPPGTSGNVRPAYRNSAERNEDRQREAAAVARIADRLAAEAGADGTDPVQNMAIGKRAREIFAAGAAGGTDVDLSTSCQPTRYSEPDKATPPGIVDAEWWDTASAPREVTAT